MSSREDESVGIYAQVMGSAIFLVVWLLLLRNRWPCFPLGRTISASGGACLLVAAGVLSPSAAYGSINLETIALLTGCMLVSAHLSKQGGYRLLARILAMSSISSRAYLGLVCFSAAVSAALLTNDTACVTLTPVVIEACRARRLHPAPFLLALATSANIGAAASPIGSPQNMLIAVTSGMSFLQFIAFLAVPAVIGVFINWLIVVATYRAQLGADAVPFAWNRLESEDADESNDEEKVSLNSVVQAHQPLSRPPAASKPAEALEGGRVLPAGSAITTTTGPASNLKGYSAPSSEVAVTAALPTGASAQVAPISEPTDAQADSAAIVVASQAASQPQAAVASLDVPSETLQPPTAPPLPTLSSSWRPWVVRALLVCFPPVLAVSSAWIGLGWSAMLYAALLCAVDGTPPEPLLKLVDGSLLLFFGALFVCVAGFNATGLPQAAWFALGDLAGVDSPAGATLFTIVVLVGSQVVSNVPLVLLLSPRILELPTEGRQQLATWALLSWVSTIGGNLTLLGSVANLIVAEKAKSVYSIGFVEYARIGFPSTCVLCAVGVPLVYALVHV